MLGEDVGRTVTRLTHRKQNSKPVATYNGHRRNSFITPDIDELTELRARQRTFDGLRRGLGGRTGAYTRTALGLFDYALLILKIFSAEFAKIGLLYVILGTLILLIGYHRARRGDVDFADEYRTSPTTTISPPSTSAETSKTPEPRTAPSEPHPDANPEPLNTTQAAIVASAPPHVAHAVGPKLWGRPFRTSGDVVVVLCLVCVVLYAAIFALVMEL
ncbi:BZ3500_MvSof-1268-A1-R1_Chr12-3g04051 [Microbotryum saponariae]|uniref:BZ3500_MvSof-1268-A1-R1_Chr12-3g04051 protein n=1 Tax=Microbotryum saponariae TaxID=289078 RepID=A0A2X0MRZ2_9BASI|nr:BZ3500_MvSof-1268-A1-R1_Chr12-3g04051 [Microbotryum saponariae]SDA02606.1 BZ3501_MvSof-1269-A2-R1_Chr12-3g03706 [Microbotryum saponariae]